MIGAGAGGGALPLPQAADARTASDTAAMTATFFMVGPPVLSYSQGQYRRCGCFTSAEKPHRAPECAITGWPQGVRYPTGEEREGRNKPRPPLEPYGGRSKP